MKLEDEIKQSKFRNEYHKLGVNIIYTANWLSYHYFKSCKKFDITPEQYNLLRILRGQYPNPATINLLIERMLNKMSNASRLVEKLRKKGLVERKTCEKDRRACDVFITKEGLELLTKMDKIETKWIKLFTKITKQDAKKVNRILDKLRTLNNKNINSKTKQL